MSEDRLVSSTKQSKIVKYKLENDVVALRQSGLSYQQIADELNLGGKVPDDDKIDKYVVMRFLEKIPEIQKQLVKEDRQRLMQVVSTNIDIIDEVTGLYGKTKKLLELMEEDAFEKGRILNPYQYKALVSEMREMLKQMTDIQREINDYDNIKRFMQIVLETLKDEAPDAIPIIVKKLRYVKETQWFSNILNK